MRVPRKSDCAELGQYALAVVGHYVGFVWFILAGALGIWSEFKGSLQGIPTWTWWVLAVVGLSVSQFRAYHDLRSDLARALARAADLSTTDAKRAYIRDAHQDGMQLKAEIDADEFEDEGTWRQNRPRLEGDLITWESDIRRILKRWPQAGLDRFFDSEDDLVTEEHMQYPVTSRGNASSYIERRLARLSQIEEELG